MKTNRTKPTNVVVKPNPNRLELLRGCQFTGLLRLYRLTDRERQLFRVEQDNSGIIAVIA